MFAKKRSYKDIVLRWSLACVFCLSTVLTVAAVFAGGNLGIRSNNVGGISVDVEGVVGQPSQDGAENLRREGIHPAVTSTSRQVMCS